MPSLNNYRERHLQSAKNTLNDLLKRQDINNSTSTFSPVIQIPTAQISSDGGSFKHDTKVNQGIVNFILIIGILMGITITTGIIIYTYIYRKRLMCKQSSSSNSNDRVMMVYNYYKGNQTDQSNVHPDAYNHQYDVNDEEYDYDNKKSHIIDVPGYGGSDMVKEKSVEDISVSRSNTAKTNRSIKSTKSLGDKISPPHFSSPTKLPSVSVYDNERAKSLTWTETNRFQITRPAPPAPPIPALQTTKDKTKDLVRVPTIVYDDDYASSQYSDSTITKNPSDLHTKPRPSPSSSLSTSSNSSPSRSYNRESDIYSIYNCYSPTRSSEIKGSIHLPEVRLTTQRSGINVDGLFSGQSELNLEPLSNVPETQVNDRETAQGGDYYPKESGPNYTTTYYL